MKKQIFEALTSPIKACFKNANAFNVNLMERFQPVYKLQLSEGKELTFFCPNALALWRAQTLFSKEPDTIEWINGFEPNNVFYDVGANVGVYSLYSAATKPLTVYAFEPESQNYALLNRNIYLNHLQECIQAYNFAISETAKIDHLYLAEFNAGGALNNFGEEINYKKEKFQSAYKQGVASFTLDTLIAQFRLPIPNYLKIDVDGLEANIIAGADHLLSQKPLKSVLIELNTELDTDLALIDVIKNKGFTLTSCYRHPLFANSPFKNIYNHIFTRTR